MWAFGRDGGDSARRGRPGADELTPTQALIFGRVTDARSNRPLEGAVVKVDHAGGPLTARTDAEGNYRAVVEVSRPLSLTVDAEGHLGTAAFARLCPGERRDVSIALAAAGRAQAPPAPLVIEPGC